MTRIEKQIQLQREYLENLKKLESEKPNTLKHSIKNEKWEIVGSMTCINDERGDFVRIKTSMDRSYDIPIGCVPSIIEGLIMFTEDVE